MRQHFKVLKTELSFGSDINEKAKNIDARVTDLVHDTSSYQVLSLYEVSFQ